MRCMGLRGRSAASAVNGEYCRRAIAAGDDQLVTMTIRSTSSAHPPESVLPTQGTWRLVVNYISRAWKSCSRRLTSSVLGQSVARQPDRQPISADYPVDGGKSASGLAHRGSHCSRCSRESNSAESPIGSAWRCTIFHSPFSRRKIVVLRSMYGVGSEPATDAVVRSMARR